MAKSSVYSMLNVQAVLNALPVVGFWDGDDVVVVTEGADVGAGIIGADGSSIFSQSADKSATINIKVQHTSATHRQLLQLLSLQQSGNLGGFPFTVMDRRSGEGGATDQAFIQQAPVDQKGKAATVREWLLWTGTWVREIPNG